MPASEKKLKLASLLYYQGYGEELPLHDYTQQDIEYIIDQLKIKLEGNADVFNANILH